MGTFIFIGGIVEVLQYPRLFRVKSQSIYSERPTQQNFYSYKLRVNLFTVQDLQKQSIYLYKLLGSQFIYKSNSMFTIRH